MQANFPKNRPFSRNWTYSGAEKLINSHKKVKQKTSILEIGKKTEFEKTFLKPLTLTPF